MTAKSLDSQNVWGGGGGNRRHQYKLRYLARIVVPLIYSVIMMSGQP